MRSIINIPAGWKAMVLFSSVSLLFFSLFYYNHLYQREQTQLFELTTGYFLRSLSTQGGFAIYSGEFLIQFFRVPLLGALIITAWLVLLQHAAGRLINAICQTADVQFISWFPSLIYCILLTRQFYYLSGLIGLIIAVYASLWYVTTGRSNLRLLKGLIIIPLLYWLAGGGFLVYTVNIVISEIVLLLRNRKSRSVFETSSVVLIYLILTISVPLLARSIVVTDTVLQSYLSEAYYAVPIFFPLPLILVFCSVPFLLIICGILLTGSASGKRNTAGNGFVFILAGLTITGLFFFADFKEEKEMKYENLVYDEKWVKIIKTAESDKPSGHVSMTAVNLALAMTGRMPAEMFRFNQKEDYLFIPYIRRGMTPFTASEPFYYLGLNNFSQMFAIETIESTVDARLPSRSVRRAAATYMLNGQYEIANKYYTILSHSVFYRNDATKLLKLADPETDPEIAGKRQLISKYDFFYDYQNMDFALKNLIVSNPQNRMAFEYLMAYYLLKKDLDGFLGNIGFAGQMGYPALPQSWQEAAAYILTRIPEAPEELRSMVSDPVIENLRAYANSYNFNSMDTVNMKKEYGNTYWYYLHYN